MIDRRRFLQGTLLVSALPLVPGLTAAIDAPRLVVTAASGCADGRHFADAWGGGLLRAAAHDPWELFAAIEEAVIRSRPSAVAGLGLESHYFILRAEAARLGLEPVYVGRHAYTPHGLTHHLEGGVGAGELARSLAAAGARWPALLAATMGRLRERGRVRCATRARVPRPRDGSGHLVSWVFTPVAA